MRRQPITFKKVRVPGSGNVVKQSPGYVPGVRIGQAPIPRPNRAPAQLSRAARARVTSGNTAPISIDYFPFR